MQKELLEQLKNEFTQKGYFAKIRKWMVGEALAVGHKPQISADGKIEMIQRVFYLAQRENGSWYTLVGGIDIDDNCSFDEVKEYSLKVLSMTKDEYLLEVNRRFLIIQ